MVARSTSRNISLGQRPKSLAQPVNNSYMYSCRLEVTYFLRQEITQKSKSRIGHKIIILLAVFCQLYGRAMYSYKGIERGDRYQKFSASVKRLITC